MMRRIEDETDMMEEEFKKKNPDESEEAENHVLDLELEVRRYQEQVSQMIDDNESLIRSLQDAEEEVEPYRDISGHTAQDASVEL